VKFRGAESGGTVEVAMSENATEPGGYAVPGWLRDDDLTSLLAGDLETRLASRDVSHVQCKSDFFNGRQRCWNRSFYGPANAEIAESDWGEWRLVSDLTNEEATQRRQEEREARERDPPKNRWTVYQRYDGDGELVGYVVRDQFGDLDREKEFAPEEDAEAEAEAREWNRFDRQGPLPPEFEDRRRHLAKVPGSHFNVAYGDGDLPAAPERFAVVVWDDRYGESFVELADSLTDALGRVEGEGEGTEVWDLDTGEKLPVKLEATVAS
jgi:hypothetical protein